MSVGGSHPKEKRSRPGAWSNGAGSNQMPPERLNRACTSVVPGLAGAGLAADAEEIGTSEALSKAIWRNTRLAPSGTGNAKGNGALLAKVTAAMPSMI